MSQDTPVEQVSSRPTDYRRSILLALVLAILGGVLAVFTAQISPDTPLGSLAPHRNRLLAAEVALFGILIVEIVGRAILQRARQAGTLQLGIAIRAILRTIAYLVIGVSVISMLAQNPALAVSVGSLTGLIIGFSTQNIIGNAFAGMFLAIGRPFKVGDEITVMGNTGRVVEIGVMHTIIDAGDRWVLIPSMSMMTNVLQRKKAEPDDHQGLF